MKDFSYITQANPAYIENLYNNFVKDPSTVDPEWKKFFEGFDFAINNKNGHSIGSSIDSNQIQKEFSVYQLIQAYRKKSHLIAKTNPIRERKDRRANLALENFGLAELDMQRNFQAGKFVGLGETTLANIVAHLQKSYTNSIGIEYAALNDQAKIEWLVNEVENKIHQPLSLEQRKRILNRLNHGVIFEKFLHTKYIGQKRFSLEGGETTIPALDNIINTAADHGVQEVVIGMAHRGRLNILANILGKTYEKIFNEFEGNAVPDSTMGSGDVKYHLGFRSEIETINGKKINVQLCPNPSHLEAVDPLVIGFSRAKADVLYNSDYDKILPILIHGDSSLAGQGVVYEVLQMSNLKGYYTGGTIHFVINNQIGFTTDFDDARSSDYCTSLASIVQAPVLHVNGDDAEAVVKLVEIATRYRQEFNSDIFIDMVCYRKHGHNEGDDPKFTQPKLYEIIDNHPNPREVYTKFLIEHGEPEAKQLATEMEKAFWNELQERLDEVKQKPLPYTLQASEQWWKNLRFATITDFEQSPHTAITHEAFEKLFNSIMHWPQDFKPLRKIEKIITEKIKLYNEEQKIDWATAELLAYASLLLEGHDVRMSGQDICRGTFSHRHAILTDENTNEPYNRLSNITDATGKFRIYNSLLSEFGVLGFEYGYALATPNSLVVWEAQFGDFGNGAQTIIDQFIVSAEQKWRKMNGLVLLLPHGYEGQGPEHSSARMERFLQMCAELNMVVTNITTASNLFHASRRQLKWPFRKPLIIFSPKANLRHTGSYSSKVNFLEDSFKEVMDDEKAQPDQIKKVLMCSGKIYFELFEKQQKDQRSDVAIIRLEQLYPLPIKQLAELKKKYVNAIWFWVQEEPLNMGAASFLQMNMNASFKKSNLPIIQYGVISREPSAATATGFAKIHAKEQAAIIDTAFSI